MTDIITLTTDTAAEKGQLIKGATTDKILLTCTGAISANKCSGTAAGSTTFTEVVTLKAGAFTGASDATVSLDTSATNPDFTFDPRTFPLAATQTTPQNIDYSTKKTVEIVLNAPANLKNDEAIDVSFKPASGTAKTVSCKYATTGTKISCNIPDTTTLAAGTYTPSIIGTCKAEVATTISVVAASSGSGSTGSSSWIQLSTIFILAIALLL